MRSAKVPFTEFWAHYLDHHRHPATRLLHSLGSLICIAGAVGSVRLLSLWPVVFALVLGYFCAFAGHWWVERNQPLTFRHPLRAALCNWLLFGVEVRGLLGFRDFSKTRAAALALVPLAAGCGSLDIGGQ